jgi:hypothetical protein
MGSLDATSLAQTSSKFSQKEYQNSAHNTNMNLYV